MYLYGYDPYQLFGVGAYVHRTAMLGLKPVQVKASKMPSIWGWLPKHLGVEPKIGVGKSPKFFQF